MIASLKAAAITLPLVLAAGVSYDPHELIIHYADGTIVAAPATDQDSCDAAILALYLGKWRLQKPFVSLACVPGNGFTEAEGCIAHFNCGRPHPPD